MHLVLPVALQHCELIEIGQQRAISRIHVASYSNEKLYQHSPKESMPEVAPGSRASQECEELRRAVVLPREA